MSVRYINLLNDRPMTKFTNINLSLSKPRSLLINKSPLINNYNVTSNIFLLNRLGYIIRSFSANTNLNIDTIDKKNFFEWLSGFTDAEGHFYIAITNKTVSFRYQINLHKDDVDTLYFIQKFLGLGEVRFYRNYVSFTVTRLKDIGLIIDIFNKYPLQSTKWLNFKDFSLAYSYVGIKPIEEIIKIKNNMNRSRSDFNIPKNKVINITSYWLLGFIEGEGCFSINKHNNYRLDFSICQSSSNLPLMQSIKLFIETLPGNDGSVMGISEVKFNNPNHESVVRIETARISFITNVLVPFLNSLTWQSKKYLDFQDWNNILRLKEQGHHLSNEGIKLIDLILNQMNNNRLSTSKSISIDTNINRKELLSKVEVLINGPSNFEIRNGKKFVISLNKYYNSSRVNINTIIVDENNTQLYSFDSLRDCAKFLNVDPSTVSKKKSKNISFILDNKSVFIKDNKD